MQLSEVKYRLALKIIYAVPKVTVSFRNDPRGQRSHNVTQSPGVCNFPTLSSVQGDSCKRAQGLLFHCV